MTSPESVLILPLWITVLKSDETSLQNPSNWTGSTSQPRVCLKWDPVYLPLAFYAKLPDDTGLSGALSIFQFLVIIMQEFSPPASRFSVLYLPLLLQLLDLTVLAYLYVLHNPTAGSFWSAYSGLCFMSSLAIHP